MAFSKLTQNLFKIIIFFCKYQQDPVLTGVPAIKQDTSEKYAFSILILFYEVNSCSGRFFQLSVKYQVLKNGIFLLMLKIIEIFDIFILKTKKN